MAADVRRRVLIVGKAGGEVEALVQVAGDVVVADPSGSHGCLDGGEVSLELGLLLFELVHVEEAFEVGVAQSLEGVL